MKSLAFAVSAGTALLLCGCAYGPPPPPGYGPVVGMDYYDGYYDGYYGPFYDGYWGPEGYFYYSDARGGWHRDEGRHFRRGNGGSGWSHVHGSGRGGPPRHP